MNIGDPIMVIPRRGWVLWPAKGIVTRTRADVLGFQFVNGKGQPKGDTYYASLTWEGGENVAAYVAIPVARNVPEREEL